MPVGAYEHSFSCNSSALCNTGLIVIDKIFSDSSKAVRITDNNIKFCNCLFAFFYLVFIRAFLSTLIVIILYFLNFCLIESYLSCTSIIYKIYSDTVLNSFCHGIGIHNSTEDLYCSINRRSSEAYISGIRQGVMKIFCKAIRSIYSLGSDP